MFDPIIRHCEERSDEAIHRATRSKLDCFATLAMSLINLWSNQRIAIFGQQQNLRDADLHRGCGGNEVRPLAGLALEAVDGIEADIETGALRHQALDPLAVFV